VRFESRPGQQSGEGSGNFGRLWDLDEMARESVWDVIHILTPPRPLRADSRGSEDGVPCFVVEKPMAPSAGECGRMLAAKETGPHLSVNHSAPWTRWCWRRPLVNEVPAATFLACRVLRSSDYPPYLGRRDAGSLPRRRVSVSDIGVPRADIDGDLSRRHPGCGGTPWSQPAESKLPSTMA